MSQPHSAERILDLVTDILRSTNEALPARLLVEHLASRGVVLSKGQLNEILHAKRNRRPDLVRDDSFRWSYVPPRSAGHGVAQEGPESAEGLLQALDSIDFEWQGVRRLQDGRWFYFLEEHGGQFSVVGPTGRIMRERRDLFAPPTEVGPGAFTASQVAAAVKAVVDSRTGHAIREREATISNMLHSELLAPHAYQGPISERIRDAIPVDANIQCVALVNAEPWTLRLGPGVIVAPLYLVIDLIAGLKDAGRYGVFRVCTYELVKRKLIRSDEGDLQMALRATANGVVIDGGEALFALE